MKSKGKEVGNAVLLLIVDSEHVIAGGGHHISREPYQI